MTNSQYNSIFFQTIYQTGKMAQNLCKTRSNAKNKENIKEKNPVTAGITVHNDKCFHIPIQLSAYFPKSC